jgi:hypothetical protein
LTSASFLPFSSSALVMAAPTMMAVPCWSSWKTGIFMRALSCASISKHSGPLMSSRLMPPKVGSSAATVSTTLDGVGGDLDVEHVDAGEFLEQDRLAFHHRLRGQRADIAEAEHRGAVGDHRDQIGAGGQLAASAGFLAISRQAPRRPANRPARGRAGWRAAWSPGSRVCPAAAADDRPVPRHEDLQNRTTCISPAGSRAPPLSASVADRY